MKVITLSKFTQVYGTKCKTEKSALLLFKIKYSIKFCCYLSTLNNICPKAVVSIETRPCEFASLLLCCVVLEQTLIVSL